MFSIDNNTQVPDYTKLPMVPEDSDVTVLLTEFKDLDGVKGHYAIFEGKVSKVDKGPMAVGQGVRVFMTRLDDSRRILKQKDGSLVNYAIIDTVKFLEEVNGEPFDKSKLSETVDAFCAGIQGMAIRIVSRKNPGNAEKKIAPFIERTHVHVGGQDVEAQRKTLAAL